MMKCVECASYVEIIYVEDGIFKTAKACAKNKRMKVLDADDLAKGCKSFSLSDIKIKRQNKKKQIDE